MRNLFIIALLLFAGGAKADQVWVPFSSHFLDYSSVAVTHTSDLTANTEAVRLVCTTACYVAIASSGDATVAGVDVATSTYLPANNPVVFGAPRNGNVIVVSAGSDGLLIITELTK